MSKRGGVAATATVGAGVLLVMVLWFATPDGRATTQHQASPRGTWPIMEGSEVAAANPRDAGASGVETRARAPLPTGPPPPLLIPRQIVQSYSSRGEVPDDVVRAWGDMNPGWKYKFYSDIESVAFLLEHFNETYVRFFSSPDLQGKYRADFFRYCYLYAVGGFWADIDIPPLRPLDEVLHRDTALFLVPDGGWHVVNALVGSVPGHPVLRRAIDTMLEVGPRIGLEPATKNEWPYHNHPCRSLWVILEEALAPQRPMPGLHQARGGQIQLGEIHEHEQSYADVIPKEELRDRSSSKCLKQSQTCVFCVGDTPLAECRYGPEHYTRDGPGRGFHGFDAAPRR